MWRPLRLLLLLALLLVPLQLFRGEVQDILGGSSGVEVRATWHKKVERESLQYHVR